ncbi:MAG: hypothetical protein AAGH57_06705 [Pseudomonadota bacterium]
MLEVRAVGATSDSELNAVVVELEKLPPAELAMLASEGVSVVVCHDNVTNYNTEFFEKDPSGWPKDIGWSDVPGTYLPAKREIVIATILGSDGQRHIPRKGEMHGTHNLVLHETMHASDFVAGRLRCNNAALKQARLGDLQKLGAYYKTFTEGEGHQVGLQETYAESAARFFDNDPSMATEWPTLSAFWRNCEMPLEPGDPAHMGDQRRGRAAAPILPIGLARAVSEGRYEIDLRAETDAGIVGHALIAITEGHPAFEQVDARFQSQRRRGEDSIGQEILLQPF